MIFTRFLYTLDEVFINLLIELLKKEDFNKVIFWTSEIVQSVSSDVYWEIFWNIYYDFYAIQSNFSLTKYRNNFIKWEKEKNYMYILNFIYKLFNDNYSFDIFIVTHLYEEKNKQIPNDTYFKLLSILIEQNKVDSFYKFLKLGLSYIEEKKIIKFLEKNTGRKFKENIYFKNKTKQLLVFTFQLKTTRKSIKDKIPKIYKENINKLFRFEKHIPVEKTLQIYRKYGISELTSCFKLARELLPENMNIQGAFWYHWEYYAYKSSFWNSKFVAHNAVINREQKIIEFKDDTDSDNFYIENNYDVDELPLDVREKGCKQLNHELEISDLFISLDKDKLLLFPLSSKLEHRKCNFYNITEMV